jgi:ribosomal protein L11 methyltransferase
VSGVEFRVADLSTGGSLPRSDVVTANLTGALLRRAAPILIEAVQPGGVLIVSGLLAEERDDVAASFAGVQRVDERAEGEWVAITWQAPPTP